MAVTEAEAAKADRAARDFLENHGYSKARDIPTPTAEMLDAGEDVLLCHLGGAVEGYWDAFAIATAVFLAMKSKETR